MYWQAFFLRGARINVWLFSGYPVRGREPVIGRWFQSPEKGQASLAHGMPFCSTPRPIRPLHYKTVALALVDMWKGYQNEAEVFGRTARHLQLRSLL